MANLVLSVEEKSQELKTVHQRCELGLCNLIFPHGVWRRSEAGPSMEGERLQKLASRSKFYNIEPVGRLSDYAEFHLLVVISQFPLKLTNVMSLLSIRGHLWLQRVVVTCFPETIPKQIIYDN